MENPKNLILVIFGATGDLTSRKLIPAIFSLNVLKLLPVNFAIIGVGRKELSKDEFRIKMKKSILSFSEEKDLNESQIETFLEQLYYHSMDYVSEEGYERLKNILSEMCMRCGIAGNCIFYMATPPNMYETIAVNLAKEGVADESAGFRRFIIEKPFGYDLESARKLNRTLHEIIEEKQIYRIDHYLGKETVQNLLVTRFANGIFEPLWNRNYVDRIEITSAESIGSGRSGQLL